MFTIVHPWILFFISCAIGVFGYYRWFYYTPTRYSYSLVEVCKQYGYQVSILYSLLPFILRCLVLLLLGLLISKIRLIDVTSKVPVEGIDIMIALDASRSMICFDELHDERSRFLIAKTEAINFIEKRENDQIGLVLFGRDAVSRCPLTLDKSLLKEILYNFNLGDINPDGTVINVALAMAARRLKDSKSKSKIIILLTDGESTPNLDINVSVALDLLKKLDVKIYTIGVGGDYGGLIREPFGVVALNLNYNKDVLKMLAQETGGKFFESRNAEDMKQIYKTIDALEKVEYESDIFARYVDIVTPLIVIIGLLLLCELLCAWIWFTL